jgi:hypothetical protein
LSCAICEQRKEKRFCPALHGRICPQCCGEQREVTIDCPSDCPYLRQAREHEKFLPPSGEAFPEIEITDYFLYEHERLIAGIAYLLVKTARTDTGIRDRDLVLTLSFLARRYQTLVNSGLHYDVQATSLGQQALVDEIEQLVSECREGERRDLGYSRLRDAQVLTALVFLLRLAEGHTSGRPKSRAFLDFLASRFPPPQSTILAPRDAPQIIRP